MLSDFYLISAAVGTVYLIIGLLLGQLHGHGDAGMADGGAGGDGSVGHADVHVADASVGADSGFGQGHAGGGEIDLDVAGDAGHADAGHVHDSQHHQLDPYGTHAHHGAQHTDRGPVQIMERRRLNPWRILLTLLSPMTIAVFLAFMGAFGLLLVRAFPWMGAWSAIPAVLVSLFATSKILTLLRWMIFKMSVSSHTRVSDLIGTQAEVLTPIREGRTGEITYVAASRRLSAPARAVAGAIFERGSKVMISDIKDGIFYVEPWKDLLLEDLTGGSLFEQKEKVPDE